jgi:hypothetical protein
VQPGAAPVQARYEAAAAMVQEAPLKIYARGVVLISYFYFYPRAPRLAPRARALKIRQINSVFAFKQNILDPNFYHRL